MKYGQRGKTLVEMLGVLSIIGVLSIGGIAGYRLVMQKYRAAQIMDMASKTATLALIAYQGQGGSLVVGEYTGCPSTNGHAPLILDLKWQEADGIKGFCGISSEGAEIVTVHLDAPPSTQEVRDILTNIAGVSLSDSHPGYNGSTTFFIRTN